MPFVRELLKYDSISIVGLEKNTGKTECLNYLIKRLPLDIMTVAVSSIGVDGERRDQVTRSSKPEILLRDGMLFGTSEQHYRSRRVTSELLDIGDERTSLGRVITARALCGGKVLLSGPSSTASLRRWMDSAIKNHNADLCIIDGALSRMSLASPVVSKSMILATGAALSANIKTLVTKTAFVVGLVNIPVTKIAAKKILETKDNGVWSIGENGDITPLGISSVISYDKLDSSTISGTKAIFISGALTDRFLNTVCRESGDKEIELIVRDFTKIFVTPLNYNTFLKRGGKISVLKKSKLLAVCVNPTAPDGTRLDSDKLCHELEKEIGLPVYDIIKNEYEA
jgi:hypothetical protein